MVIHPTPPVPHMVLGQHVTRRQAGLLAQAVVQGGKVHLGQLQRKHAANPY